MSRRRTGHHHARKVAAAAVAAVAAFGLTACQGNGDTKAGPSTSTAADSRASGSQGSGGSPDAEAKNGEGGAAALRKTDPKPLRDGAGLYPRAIRLEHSGKDNGRVLASTVVPGGGNGIGAIQESTDGGANFNQVGTIADPASADGKGLCCSVLYELPQRVGDMPAGTLLWAASFGQDVPKADRHMSIRVFKSTDVGRNWSYLSTVATAPNANGLWEPEFSIDAEGNLVCHYSDETDPRHSQKLVAVRSRDGVSWDGPHDTVASAPVSDRPGMAVVRKLPNGTYVMTYEICSDDPKFSCVVHYRTSSDGWDWGDPANLGTRPQTADGKYFKHAPTLAWAPEAGNPQGKLLLVGQVMYNADGSKAEGSGRTVWTNSKGGEGAWKEIPAPVAVKSDKIDFCPNYSSSLLPSADGHQLLEIATDYDGGVCRPYHATDGI
ncbi:sialidase family protein [Streptomyces rhizosphaericus]|uniref:Exo-alpha-sialidase n=1 Tax=Streptomyces rhizosphaericus TaxID=114699 RepID=A0A6G4AJ59_9ACTN|nr:sialidase family protein [Streptomyces rhizosphaericus]NEW73476.1 exo-alpha-sialidase [Streptomyces rhizosphaericus]